MSERPQNKNLIPFKKGQVANPKGRPKKEFSLTSGMKAFLKEKDPEKRKIRKDILIEKTYMLAQKGDIAAIKLLWNYIDGMPKGSAPIVPIDARQQKIEIVLTDEKGGEGE